MSADRPRTVVSVFDNVFFAVRIVTWPIVIACLVLPNSNQILPLLVEIIVVVQALRVGTGILVNFFWTDDLDRLRIEQRENSATIHFLQMIERHLYGTATMVLAIRLASLKFVWAFLVILVLFGLAATLYGSREYRLHPEKYPAINSTPVKPTTMRTRAVGVMVGFAFIGIWLYAWRDWIL